MDRMAPGWTEGGWRMDGQHNAPPRGRPQALLKSPLAFSLLSGEAPPLGRTGALALTLYIRPGGPCPRLSDGTLAPMRPSIGPSRDIFSNQGPSIKKAVLPQAK